MAKKKSNRVIGLSFSDNPIEYSVIIVAERRDGKIFILDTAQMFCKPMDDANPKSEFRKKVSELAKKYNAKII